MRFIQNQADSGVSRSDRGDADQEGIHRHIGGDRHGAVQYGAIERVKFLCMISMVDPQMAENEKRKRKPKGRRRGKRLGAGGRKGRVLVSGTMLIETETVLQTQVSLFCLNFV